MQELKLETWVLSPKFSSIELNFRCPEFRPPGNFIVGVDPKQYDLRACNSSGAKSGLDEQDLLNLRTFLLFFFPFYCKYNLNRVANALLYPCPQRAVNESHGRVFVIVLLWKFSEERQSDLNSFNFILFHGPPLFIRQTQTLLSSTKKLVEVAKGEDCIHRWTKS